MVKHKRVIIPALFVILITVVAIGVSSFREKKEFATYNFNLSVDPSSESAVETLTNWVQSGSLTCTSNINQMACSITVPEELTETDPDSGLRILKSSAQINAAQHTASGKWYVSSGNYTNRFNKTAP